MTVRVTSIEGLQERIGYGKRASRRIVVDHSTIFSAEQRGAQ
jgi:hypothetical protein